MRPLKALPFLAIALFAIVQIGGAQTWVQTPAPVTNWISLASSADGAKLVAAATGGMSSEGNLFTFLPGSIYISTNSGFAWYQTPASNEVWQSVACSADGSIIAAVPQFGSIYLSSDSGETWKAATNAPTALWGQVAVSGDGSTIIASIPGATAVPGAIYISTNSGNSWSQTSAPNDEDWSSLAISQDGSKMIGGAIDGFVYFSTNSGLAWTQASLRNVIWGGVAVSADGTTFVAAANLFFDPVEDGGPIYISTNSGAGWFQSGAPIEHWQGVAASADGSRFVTTDTEGEIYTSPDRGATWIKNAAPSLGWSSVTSSSDATKLAAVVNGGGIYIPMLGIKLSSGEVMLSWPSNSFNFTLQQNMDVSMTNWNDLTNTPELNLTNLQYQLTVPPTNGARYYRLKSVN